VSRQEDPPGITFPGGRGRIGTSRPQVQYKDIGHRRHDTLGSGAACQPASMQPDGRCLMMLEHALELAACGWAVLPLDGKVPRTANGVHDATKDPDQVRAWWRRWPSANIGAKVPDALIVFDIDPRHGGLQGWQQLTAGRGIPDTLDVVSGRGDGGTHHYFVRPLGPITSARVPKGIDLKLNGYMVMPPSLHPDTGQPYTWHDISPVPLPLWLREVLRPDPPKTWNPMSPNTSHTGHGLVGVVARQEEGNRNKALYWAALRALESGVLDQIDQDLIAAAVSTGLDHTEAEHTLISARRKGR
jgi:hypothetical protein